MPASPLILFGRVLSTQDPLELGRVQVETRGFGEAYVLPWIRVLQSTASVGHGHLFLPEIGDEVVVLNGLGDRPEGMLVIGSAYGGARPPVTPDATGTNDLKEIRTRAGHALSFSDEDGGELVSLTSGDAKLSLVFDMAAGSVTITSDKLVSIEAPSADLTVKANNVAVEGAGSVAVTSSGSVSIEGGDLTLKGMTVAIE